MKKHPVAAIVFIAILIVAVGTSVAYYNTKRFGFDEDAVILLQEEDGITIFDFKIYYEDIDYIYKRGKEYLPNEAYSTDPHLSEFIYDYVSQYL